MQEIIMVIAVNAVLAVVIGAAAWLIVSRSPVRARKLRRLVKQGTIQMNGELPCGGRLLAAAELQRTLLDDPSPVPLLTALLLRWQACGAITLADRPKKVIKSFGEAIQPELEFAEDTEPPQMEAAEALLWQTLRAWAGEDASLQQNEFYNRARDGYAELTDRLEHLHGAGRHQLREMGVSRWEEKPGFLIFAGEQREVYSQKGIRTARGLLSYRKFCDASEMLRGEQALFAVLVGSDRLADPETLRRARALAEAGVKGAAAGAQAGARSAR